MVFAEVRNPAARRTVLVYGHYDVQPPDPLELWQSPPFEPTLRDGRLWGRGTGDNKGQLFAHVKAVEALLAVEGRLPVNVKLLFEGEEEVGSRNLRGFIEANRDLLAADYCYCSDGGMYPNDQPTVMFGVRGNLYVEVTAYGANRDVHSGNLGPYVPSPARRLVGFLSSLTDAAGRAQIKGFYDDVLPLLPNVVVGRVREHPVVDHRPRDRDRRVRHGTADDRRRRLRGDVHLLLHRGQLQRECQGYGLRRRVDRWRVERLESGELGVHGVDAGRYVHREHAVLVGQCRVDGDARTGE
jgi:hypothetical protein